VTNPTIAELVIADDPSVWRSAGFDIDDETLLAGSVPVRLAGPAAGKRIAGWALRDLESDDLDGLPTTRSDAPPPDSPGGVHPNGVARFDHIVAFSPSLDRTDRALEAAGLDFRRRREGPTPAGAVRQSFFRLGEVILEVVEHPAGTPAAAEPDAPARFWGLAFVVEDLDATARYLGPLLGDPRPAVQPGRSIATLKREAGLTVPVAFITPVPESG
jgi:hypothetical protein